MELAGSIKTEPAKASHPKGQSVRRQIGLEGCHAPKVNEISGSIPNMAGKSSGGRGLMLF